MGAGEDVGVLHSEPGGEHASVGAAEDDDGPVRVGGVFEGVFDVLEQLDVVVHRLLDRDVLVVLGRECGLWTAAGVGSSEETVLGENYEALCVFCHVVCDEAGIIVKNGNVSFVTCVEKDWRGIIACFEISVVH